MAKVLEMKFSILFDQKHLHRSSYGSITAPLYIEITDYQFPEKGWSDFVVVVLGWWVESMLKIVSGSTRIAEFRFMDGPQLIRLTMEDSNNAKLEFINRKLADEKIEKVASVYINEIVSELLSVSKQVINSCEQLGWESDDLRHLKKEMFLLEK